MTDETAEPVYWSSSLVTRLAPTDAAYPSALRTALGRGSPPVLTVLGDTEALRRSPVALLCSEVCPPGLVLPAYDLACELATRGVTVVSGFHSAMERECLRVLINGRRPVIWTAARGIGARLLSAGHARAVTDGRLVVITPFPRCAPRVTRAAACARNRIVVALARGVVVLYAADGGTVEYCGRLALGWGRPVRVLQGGTNEALLRLGARPLRSAELPGFAPAWESVAA